MPVLAGLALGIAVDGALKPPPLVWLVPAGAAALLTFWGVRRGLKPWGHWALAVVLVALFGGLWHGVRFRARPLEHLTNLRLDGERFYYVRGEVDRPADLHFRRLAFGPETWHGTAYWSVRVAVTDLSGDAVRWHPAEGGMTVFVGSGLPDVRVGDVVQFLARPRLNRPPTNPGQRDAALAYDRAGSHAMASVAVPWALTVLERPPWHSSPRVAIARVRSFVASRLAPYLGSETHPGRFGLVRALLFGRRGALTLEQERLLKESGTLHFLAISGLHVGLFCLFVEYALALLGSPARLRTLLTIALIWAYVLFTGAHVSAVRAGWMLTFVLAAPLLGRRRDSLSALCGAALFILLWSPQQLFSPGFQLTFVAVWAMICIYPQLSGILWPWQDFVARLRRPEERSLATDLWLWARSYLLLSCVVWVATAPIRAYHFHSVCFVAPLLNVPVWVLVLLLLLTCFALAVSALLGGVGAAALAAAAGFLSDSVEAVLRHASRLPGFGVYVPAPPGWWVALFYGVLVLWVMRRRLARGRHLFVAAAAVLAMSYLGHETALRAQRSFSLTFPDVGTGQAALLQLPQRQAILLDAGSTRQTAEQALAELLWHERVGSLNAVVGSHFNSDHCCFLPFLSRRFRIERVLLPHRTDQTGFRRRVEHWLDASGLRMGRLSEGSAIGGDGMRCRVLHPTARFLSDDALPENERSLVLRCEYGGLSVLLPGDAQSAAMDRLVLDYGDRLRSDVLVMPHQGHYHDALDGFVAHVAPCVAVVSGP
ncbi:MAG: hypothetical protein AMK73_10270 [Planctomycetes bacterium SM23_32]|nr:MAG: hypothetical protein AMK73_10270 [Planctomycetes bacterium SM23_32]